MGVAVAPARSKRSLLPFTRGIDELDFGVVTSSVFEVVGRPFKRVRSNPAHLQPHILLAGRKMEGGGDRLRDLFKSRERRIS